jgi:sulfatase modifying factor 1
MTDYRGNSTRMRLLVALTPLLASSAFGQSVTIQTVAVGDVGNAADITGYGAVNYLYSIGKYEVTNAQYAAFLNAKAATDTYGLYSEDMAGGQGGIIRSGSDGSYTYSAVSGRENWAVISVAFWNAARFTNWLQNGQGAGDTETGTYTLTASGMMDNTVTRNHGSTWAITSENEWYKAAYYKGGGPNAGYWMYPTQSNSISVSQANFGSSVGGGQVTPVGSYAFTSAYGAFDMGGNVWEWNESTIFGTYRGIRGGAMNSNETFLMAINRPYTSPGSGLYPSGFRVSQIPGPGPLGALALGSLLARGRRRQSLCAEVQSASASPGIPDRV